MEYPILGWGPGSTIDDEDDVQYDSDIYEDDAQGAPHKYGQADQYMTKTEYEHVKDGKYSDSGSDKYKDRD